MRQDLTSLPAYQTLIAEGFPEQVALRATWLLGGREHLYLDYRQVPAGGALEGGTAYEVVALTAGRVVHVSAVELPATAQMAQRFYFDKAVVWSRDNLTSVTAGGDEDAWNALLAPGAAAEIMGRRSYTLTFDGRDHAVTIPLSADKQDEADTLASSLVYRVG